MIFNYLLTGPGVPDPYMCLADFDSYYAAHEKICRDYTDRELWSRMSLMNTASAGIFAADRSIRDYAEGIWNIKPIKKANNPVK